MTGRFQLNFPEPRPRDGWFKLGGFDVTTTALLVGLGVLSMFAYAISPSSLSKLGFVPELVRDGELWRLVTWPIATDPSIWALISLAFFWIFGHRIEEMVGRTRFTRLVAILIVMPAIVVTVLGISRGGAVGIGLLGTAMLCIFAADQPNAPFFFGIPAWVIAVIFVALDVLQYVGNRWWGVLVQLLLTCALALVVMRQFGELRETMSFIPQVFGDSKTSGSRGGRSAKPAKRKKQSRDFDRVVTQGPWNGPTPGDQAEMDRLLDKMNSVGLSDVERKRLSELGKRLRGS
ncbi:MAG: rhomboid family intramembrane serine protease [Actinobacteria bacterium]|nr:rhomboid family intramembrane serine protease [Actinomycetota bacterium]